MINWSKISRQSRAIIPAGISALILALAASQAAGQQAVSAASGATPRAVADAATSTSRRIPIREALQQEFQRDGGRPADNLRWLDLEDHGQVGWVHLHLSGQQHTSLNDWTL